MRNVRQSRVSRTSPGWLCPGRKARTPQSGSEFADPDYDMSVEWLANAMRCTPPRNVKRTWMGFACAFDHRAARNDGTCPGEISKSFRLANAARRFSAARAGRGSARSQPFVIRLRPQIHPCKSCVSTAMRFAIGRALLSTIAWPIGRLDGRNL